MTICLHHSKYCYCCFLIFPTCSINYKLYILYLIFFIFYSIEGIGIMCVLRGPGQLKSFKHINTSHMYACSRKKSYLRPHLLIRCKQKNLSLGTRIIAFTFQHTQPHLSSNLLQSPLISSPLL